MNEKNGTKLFIFLMIVSIIFPMNSTVLAQSNDIHGHWAEETLQLAIESGILEGYSDGTYRPDGHITRAEFMAIVNRTFQFTDQSTQTFPDVDEDQWYADVIATAAAAGYIEGYEDGTINPEGIITRQQTAVIIARLLDLEPNANAAEHFNDEIPSWSKGSVGAVADKGMMIGLADNHFGVTEPLERAEAIVTLSRIPERNMDQTFDQPGTYGDEEQITTIQQDVFITESDVTLQNYMIEGDLTIAESVGDGDVYLNHVTVKGTTIIKGGGEDSIHVNDSQLSKVIVSKSNHKVRIATQGTTKINVVIVNSGAKIEDVDGGEPSIKSVVVEAPKGSEIILSGQYSSVTIESEDNVIQVPKGSAVETLTVNKKAEIKGEGAIKSSKINTDGVKLETKPDEVVLKEGVKAPEIAEEAQSNTPPPSNNNKGSSGGSQSGGSSQTTEDYVIPEIEPDNNQALMKETGITVGFRSDLYSLGLGDNEYAITLRTPLEADSWLTLMNIPSPIRYSSEINYVAAVTFDVANGDGLIESGFDGKFLDFMEVYLRGKLIGNSDLDGKSKNLLLILNEIEKSMKNVDKQKADRQSIDNILSQNQDILKDYMHPSNFDEDLSQLTYDIIEYGFSTNDKADVYPFGGSLWINEHATLKSYEGHRTPTLSKDSLQQLVGDIYRIIAEKKTTIESTYATSLVFDYLESQYGGYYSIMKNGQLSSWTLNKDEAITTAESLDGDVSVVHNPSNDVIWSSNEMTDVSGYWILEEAGMPIAVLNIEHSDLESSVKGTWTEKPHDNQLQFSFNGSYSVLSGNLELILNVTGKDALADRFSVEPGRTDFWNGKNPFITERLALNFNENASFIGTYHRGHVTTETGYSHHHEGGTKSAVVLRKYNGDDPFSELDYDIVEVISENVTDVPPDKVWKLNLDHTVIGQTIEIEDSTGSALSNLHISVDGQSITIQNPERYKLGATYYLHATVYMANQTIKQYQITFTIKSESSGIGSIDPELAEAIRDALDKPTGEITINDMQRLTNLNHNWVKSTGAPKITSIAGLEYATNLEHLSLKSHAITDISPIMGLEKLETIVLNGNKIDSLEPFVGTSLPNLTTLHMNQNQIKDLTPITKGDLPKLDVFEFNENEVETLCPFVPLYKQVMEDRNNGNFERHLFIYLNNNQIKDISCLDGLDLGGVLDLGHNEITSISDLTTLTVEKLDLSSNQITNISGVENINVLAGGEVNLSDNGITTINPLEKEMPFTQGALNLSHNQIVDISPFISYSFRKLNLSHNQIEDISMINEFFYVSDLNLDHNQISTLDFNGDVNINSLSLAANKIQSLVGRGNIKTVTLDLNSNQISTRDGFDRLQYKELILYGNPIN